MTLWQQPEPTMTRLVAGLPAALSRPSSNHLIDEHLLGCIAVDVRRYLSSSSSSTKPGQPKVGTTSENDAAVKSAATVGKAPDNVAADNTLATKSTSPEISGHSLFGRLTALYNENSGENELSLLKQHVTTASRQFDDAVRTVQTARLALERATSTYDDVNKRHSALLMRRDQWDADDATAFATLTAEEVQARKALAAAREALRKAEDDVSSRQVDYIDAMRRRYHEEQIWQDRWRVLGTYGTWTLIGLNSIIFLGGQVFHYQREATRLKRIEDLIRDSNSPGRVDDSRREIEAIVDGDKANEAAAVSEENEQAGENDIVVLEVDPKSATDSNADNQETRMNADDTDVVGEDDADTLVYNDITCPSDAECSDLMERLKKSRFAQRVRNVVVSISEKAKASTRGLESESNDIGDNKKGEGVGTDIVANVSQALNASVEEVHWPSAAFGAVASAVGILLICTVSGRR